MKIIINNTEFGYDIGCRLLKTKYGNNPFNGLEDIWEEIKPITFKEITKCITNIEQRRVAVGCLGIEKITKEINPTLMNKKTLKKQTTWVTEEGKMVTKKFSDTYELYKVEGKKWSKGVDETWGQDDVYFVKFKDTSTDREYMIWVDATSVGRTNTKEGWFSSEDRNKITATQAIAWTIQTDVPEGEIDCIVRQGDCILIKKKKTAPTAGTIRHLTEKEYKELLVLES